MEHFFRVKFALPDRCVVEINNDLSSNNLNYSNPLVHLIEWKWNIFLVEWNFKNIWEESYTTTKSDIVFFILNNIAGGMVRSEKWNCVLTWLDYFDLL